MLLAALAGCDGGRPPGAPAEVRARVVEFAPGDSLAGGPAALAGLCQPADGAAAAAAAPAASAAEVRRGRPAGVERVAMEEMSRLERPLRCVLRTPEAWAAFRAAAGVTDAPGPDTARMLVAVSMGMRPSTGNWLAVDSAFVAGDTLTLAVAATHAEAGSDLVTAPVHVVRVPAAARVRFLER